MSSFVSAVFTDNEIVLLKIFIVQVTAAILGTPSIATADWLYHGGRIHQALHSVWVSCSITVICLPVLAWTTSVFLGSGMLSQVVVGALGGLICFWVHRNLRKLPAVPEFGSTPAQRTDAGAGCPRTSALVSDPE
jgi:hypothetical protein